LTPIPGALLGAVFVGWTRYGLSSQAQFLVGAGGSLLILMFLRGGLAQVLYAARDGLLRWVANREGLLVPSLVADRRAEAAVEHEAEVVVDAADAAAVHPVGVTV
jgi:uncharacterized membrane protein